MHARLAGLMKEAGLRYHPSERLYDTRLAQELGKWGDEHGTPAIHDALYRAYFVDGVNLGKVEALVAVAATVGLPAGEARRVLTERTYRRAVDDDWERARTIGVTAVPTFVAAGSAVVGAQPYEVLEQLIVTAGAKRRAG